MAKTFGNDARSIAIRNARTRMISCVSVYCNRNVWVMRQI